MKKIISMISSVFAFIRSEYCYMKLFLRDYSSDQDVVFSSLRTTCHILDKGINTEPFEKGRGKSAFSRAKSLVKNINDPKIQKDPAYLWCIQIIENYKKAQVGNYTPQKNLIERFSIEEKRAIYKAIEKRVSCRNFTNEKVDDKLWDEIVALALEAPNGCCRQTVRFYIENDKDNISSLLENISGTTGFSGEIPYLICVTSDIRAFSLKDRLLHYIDNSLAIQNMLLACFANGIATTPLNWMHASSKQNNNVKSLLNIPTYEQVVIFVAAGYPRTLPVKPGRLDVKNVRKK